MSLWMLAATRCKQYGNGMRHRHPLMHCASQESSSKGVRQRHAALFTAHIRADSGYAHAAHTHTRRTGREGEGCNVPAILESRLVGSQSGWKLFQPIQNGKYCHNLDRCAAFAATISSKYAVQQTRAGWHVCHKYAPFGFILAEKLQQAHGSAVQFFPSIFGWDVFTFIVPIATASYLAQVCR